MAKMYPTEIKTTHGDVSPAERLVFTKLQDTLPDHIHVVWSYLWTDGTRQGEADFVVVDSRYLRFLVLEVKGNAIRFEDNKWEQKTTQDNWKHIIPVDQARHSMGYIKRQAQQRLQYTFHGHYALVFPDARVDGPAHHAMVGGIEYTNIIDANRVNSIDKAIEGIFKSTPHAARCTPTDIETIFDIVRPTREFTVTLESQLRQEREVWRRLSEGQMNVLKMLGNQPRIIVSGVAGSGKTLLAAEAARRAAHSDGMSSLYLCYNAPLANEVYHSLASTTKAMSAFSIGRLLRGLERKHGSLDAWPKEERWDAIFIDEAQDIDKDAWSKITHLAKCWKTAKVWFFHDPNQNLRNTKGGAIVDAAIENGWTEYDHLTENIRNTGAVVQFSVPFVNESMQVPESAPKGDPVKMLCAFTPNDVVTQVLECVRSWIEGGVPENRIAVLEVDDPGGDSAISGAKKVIVERLCGQGGRDGSIPLLFDIHSGSQQPVMHKGVRMVRMRDLSRPAYSSVDRFKGLEADAVLLIAPVDLESGQLQPRMFVGATRAQHRLAVLTVLPDWSWVCRLFWNYWDEASAGLAEWVRTPVVPSQAWREVGIRCGEFVICISLGVEPDGVRIFVRGELGDGPQHGVANFVDDCEKDLALIVEAPKGDGPMYYVKREQFDMYDRKHWERAAAYLKKNLENYVTAVKCCCKSNTENEINKKEIEIEKSQAWVRKALSNLHWFTVEEVKQRCEEVDAEDAIVEVEVREVGNPARRHDVFERRRGASKFVTKQRKMVTRAIQRVIKEKASAWRGSHDIEEAGCDLTFEGLLKEVCKELGVGRLDWDRNRAFIDGFWKAFPEFKRGRTVPRTRSAD